MHSAYALVFVSTGMAALSEKVETHNALGEAASKAIQKKFPLLRRAVTKEEVPDYLFSEGLLSASTFELNTNVGISDLEKGRKFLTEIQHLVRYNPQKFETFCSILEEHGHGCVHLVREIRGKLPHYKLLTLYM